MGPPLCLDVLCDHCNLQAFLVVLNGQLEVAQQVVRIAEVTVGAACVRGGAGPVKRGGRV